MFVEIICSITLLLILSSSFVESKDGIIELYGNIGGKKKKTKKLDSIESFVQARHAEEVLSIEFFKSSENLIITILDKSANSIFQETTHTTKTLQIIIETTQWEDGQYEISLINEEGTYLYGTFELKRLLYNSVIETDEETEYL